MASRHQPRRISARNTNGVKNPLRRITARNTNDVKNLLRRISARRKPMASRIRREDTAEEEINGIKTPPKKKPSPGMRRE